MGQSRLEEVDFHARAQGAGRARNFGWNTCEGTLRRVGGRLSLRRAGRRVALRQRTGSLPANKTARLRLRLSGTSSRALRLALRRGRRVRARVEVRVRDRSGNLTTGSRLLTLTR